MWLRKKGTWTRGKKHTGNNNKNFVRRCPGGVKTFARRRGASRKPMTLY